MVESYGSRGSSKHISHRQIQEMKKNMQKVPYIQMKSDMYHEQEKQHADSILDDIMQPEVPLLQESMENDTQNHYTQWIKKILRKLGFISQS